MLTPAARWPHPRSLTEPLYQVSDSFMGRYFVTGTSNCSQRSSSLHDRFQYVMREQTIDGELIRDLRRRLGMTQRQLAAELQVDQATISRWERGVEAPRPKRRGQIHRLFRKDECRRAYLRSLTFVRHDFKPSILFDSNLRVVEFSSSAVAHLRILGHDPATLRNKALDTHSDRFGEPEFSRFANLSGLLEGDCYFLRTVRNYGGRGHAIVYEPIFGERQLSGVLCYVTQYFDLPRVSVPTTELVEAFPVGALCNSTVLYRGPNGNTAERNLLRT